MRRYNVASFDPKGHAMQGYFISETISYIFCNYLNAIFVIDCSE